MVLKLQAITNKFGRYNVPVSSDSLENFPEKLAIVYSYYI